jgi:stage III sporulation protein SpoIIIAA
MDPYLTTYCGVVFSYSEINFHCKKNVNVSLLQTRVQVLLKCNLSVQLLMMFIRSVVKN